MLLNNISYIIKDINYFSLYKVKYIIINKEFVFNLNILIFKKKGGAVYKKVKVFKLNYKYIIISFKRQGILLKSYLGFI